MSQLRELSIPGTLDLAAESFQELDNSDGRWIENCHVKKEKTSGNSGSIHLIL